MDKNELISSMLSFKDNIGMWKIVLNQITDADFVIGYGFDNNEKLWKVYQNIISHYLMNVKILIIYLLLTQKLLIIHLYMQF